MLCWCPKYCNPSRPMFHRSVPISVWRMCRFLTNSLWMVDDHILAMNIFFALIKNVCYNYRITHRSIYSQLCRRCRSSMMRQQTSFNTGQGQGCLTCIAVHWCDYTVMQSSSTPHQLLSSCLLITFTHTGLYVVLDDWLAFGSDASGSNSRMTITHVMWHQPSASWVTGEVP